MMKFAIRVTLLGKVPFLIYVVGSLEKVIDDIYDKYGACGLFIGKI